MESKKDHLITEEDLLSAPDSEYMNKEQLAFFENKLLVLYQTTTEHIEQATQDIMSPMSFSDENDRASSEELSSISTRIINREQKLLPKIEQSIARIRNGEYGYCLESGEPIGIRRLLLRPTAEYCAEVKTQMELKEKQYHDK